MEDKSEFCGLLRKSNSFFFSFIVKNQQTVLIFYYLKFTLVFKIWKELKGKFWSMAKAIREIQKLISVYQGCKWIPKTGLSSKYKDYFLYVFWFLAKNLFHCVHISTLVALFKTDGWALFQKSRLLISELIKFWNSLFAKSGLNFCQLVSKF